MVCKCSLFRFIYKEQSPVQLALKGVILEDKGFGKKLTGTS